MFQRKILLTILLLIILSAVSPAEELSLIEIEGFEVASLVKKYKDGYLVSILADKNYGYESYYKKELEKYFERFKKIKFPPPPGSNIYQSLFLLEVDKTDFPLIEQETDFNLNTALTFFSGNPRNNMMVKGEKYYLEITPKTKEGVLEDIYVWVKGTPPLDQIKPVWAKTYRPIDLTYMWTEKRIIDNSDSKNIMLLSKIHQIIWSELNEKAQEKNLSGHLLNILKGYSVEVIEVKFKLKGGPNYLVTVNEPKAPYTCRFCLCYVVNQQGKIVEELVPATLYNQNDTDKGYWCSPMVEQIYYSKSSDKDLLIMRGFPSRGGEVFVLMEEKGELYKVTLDNWYGC